MQLITSCLVWTLAVTSLSVSAQHGEPRTNTSLPPHHEYAPYDGWFNNPHNPSYGGADTQMFRRVPAAYKDGVYEPSGHRRPNPFDISLNVFNGSTGLTSYKNRTAFLVFFGQQVVEEILDAQRAGCPPEYFNIPIPKGHPQYDRDGRGGREMPVLRTRHDMNTGFSPNVPRQQLNEITPFMDGGLVYGPNKAWADALRKFEDGLLAATNDSDHTEGYFPAYNDLRLPLINPPPPRDHKLKPVKRFFKIGNPRGNENPFLLTFGILWFRYHNTRARQLKVAHPDWTDERLFSEARRWLIAVHQKIVMYDWLPSWTSHHLETYKGYDPTINPNIAHVFQSAAMRFGHTLVVPGVYRRDAQCKFRKTSQITGSDGHKALRTCNTYWNPQEAVQEQDIEELLLGMASQHCEREDMIITPDLRGDVFGPLEFSRRDLMAINIQRARDHGIPDYNSVREAYNLPRIDRWEDVNPRMTYSEPQLIDRFRTLYNDSLDDADLWPVGLLETTADGPGELFRTIIIDQFRRIRDGDRFWYENRKNGLFTEDEIREIESTTLYDIILATTNIEAGQIQRDPFFFRNGDPCMNAAHPGPVRAEDLENCTEFKTFDYFSGSEVSYAISITALGATLLITIGVLFLLAKVRDRKVANEKLKNRKPKQQRAISHQEGVELFSANEYMGKKEGERPVVVKLDPAKKTVIILSEKNNEVLRAIDLELVKSARGPRLDVVLSADEKWPMVVIRVYMEYDLLLLFDTRRESNDFFNAFKTFSQGIGITLNKPMPMSKSMIKAGMNTKQARDKQLEHFFKTIFNHAFHYEETTQVDPQMEYTELTKVEMADALGIKPDSMFVTNMFELADADNNGYLSYHEFLHIIVIFSKGSPIEKSKLMFDMYDLDRDGALTKEQFKTMLMSLIELSNEKVADSRITHMIDTILNSIGMSDKSVITFDDFQAIQQDYKSEISTASLSIQTPAAETVSQPREDHGAHNRRTLKIYNDYRSDRDQNTAEKDKRFSTNQKLEIVTPETPKNFVEQKLLQIHRFVQNYRLQIFWTTLYTLVCVGIFAERAYYYSVEREHGGLRQIAGYGVTVTRGAASGMMFTYSSLLVTMCRNLITFLRETFLHRYIPFDSAISMHKYIAYLALAFTVMHIIGHCINFYHISTQTADDLSCLFRNFFHATDELPKFEYWMWGTITGFTGVLLTVVIVIMYVFATQYARQHAFNAFWWTHHMHILLWILTVLHGAGRLVQPPFFHYFFIGPIVLFVIDKLISISRKKIEIPVLHAELLPSDVVHLIIKRPPTFDYKSGQWLRVAALPLGKMEYHPFTISSAPHEENLSLHIRAVGPWTMNLRKLYDPANLKDHHLPKVYLDGPFGEGHQDWYRFEVAILVGGGIGVTPFASILKDLVNKSRNKEKIVCKKIYFIWITRTQKHFEWMTDIIREVEEEDLQDLVSVHIFITQFKEKFDVRTTMLYICERYFQKISSRSLLTGLRSITHFGRPNFPSFLDIIREKHNNVEAFGVFSCGPPPMTAGVEKACSSINNKYITDTKFVHHFENF